MKLDKGDFGIFLCCMTLAVAFLALVDAHKGTNREVLALKTIVKELHNANMGNRPEEGPPLADEKIDYYRELSSDMAHELSELVENINTTMPPWNDSKVVKKEFERIYGKYKPEN